MTALISALLEQKRTSISGGIFELARTKFGHGVSRLVGGRLTLDQTRGITEAGIVFGDARVADVIATLNLSHAFDDAVERASEAYPVSAADVVSYAWILAEATRRWPDELEGKYFGLVADALGERRGNSIDDILETLVRLSRVPTLDARVPWLVAFEQCLASDLTPFLVAEDQDAEYRDALARYDESPAALRELVGRAQTAFEARFARFIPPA